MTDAKPQRITRRWGVYNYDTLWDTFPTRRDARDWARKEVASIPDGKTLEKRIADGSISIEKVVVTRQRWSGQWWSTKP